MPYYGCFAIAYPFCIRDLPLLLPTGIAYKICLRYCLPALTLKVIWPSASHQPPPPPLPPCLSFLPLVSRCLLLFQGCWIKIDFDLLWLFFFCCKNVSFLWSVASNYSMHLSHDQAGLLLGKLKSLPRLRVQGRGQLRNAVVKQLESGLASLQESSRGRHKAAKVGHIHKYSRKTPLELINQ